MADSKHQRDLVALARDDLKAFEHAVAGRSDKQLAKLTDDLEGHAQYGAAESVYRMLTARHPTEERHQANLAINLYHHQRDGARAEDFLRGATDAFPSSATLAAIRGTNLAWGLGRHQDALPHYVRAVKLEPGNAANQGCLAWCLLWLGGSIELLPRGARDGHPSYGACTLEQEGISLIALDPLEVTGPDVGWQLEDYEAERAETHQSLVQPLSLSMAPDFLHKQNISGGPPYSITLPASAEDAVDPDLLDERHETTLVEYLRICFASGGFPLLEVAGLAIDDIHVNDRVAFEGLKGPWGPPAERLRKQLCRDLIPF